MSTTSTAPLKDEVVSTRLEAVLLQVLREKARENERSVSAEIRVAVKRYLGVAA